MVIELPNASSDCGMMPEIPDPGDVFFKPEDPVMIETALETRVSDLSRRKALARQAKKLVENYFWQECGKKIFSFLIQTAKAAAL